MKLEAAAIAKWTDVTVLTMFDCRVVMLAPLAHMVKLEEIRLFGESLSPSVM